MANTVSVWMPILPSVAVKSKVLPLTTAGCVEFPAHRDRVTVGIGGAMLGGSNDDVGWIRPGG